jgi:WD40 repeat protein
MPTTRAARAAAARAAERRLLELPTDVLSLVLYQLTLAHDIAAVAPTCRALCDAVKLALKLRPFSGEVVNLAGHTDIVNCVTAVSDGRIITGSHDRNIKVWRDGACERSIQAHIHMVRAVAVLPGGARFVSVANDGSAKVWMLDGTLERTIQTDGLLFDLAVIDGEHFATGGSQKWVKLFHIDGTLVATLQGHDGYVLALAATPDGQYIISTSLDETIKVWDVATKSLLSTCEGRNHVHAVAVMPDGQRFLSGAGDGTVRVWLLDGTLKNLFFRLNDYRAVEALVAMPDNQHALVGGYSIKLFNVNDGAVLRTFTHLRGVGSCLALLPDGLRFVSSSGNHAARIAYHGLAP